MPEKVSQIIILPYFPQTWSSRGHRCSYPEPKRPIRAREVDETIRSNPSPQSEGPRDSMTAQQQPPAPVRVAIPEAMLALVDIFFEEIYPLPSYAFLHPETTKKRCRDGQFHTPLAYSLCAVAAQHTGSPADRDRASRWAQDAEQSIWQHLECPTVPRLQALLLIIHHRMETGRFDRAFMLAAIAARFAAAMRLNHEHPEMDPVAREVRRRIVWSLKIVERYFAHGIPQFELCPTESIYLDFPLAEEDFSPEHSVELGAYSITVRLETVRRDIIKLTRNLAVADGPLQTSLVDLLDHHKQSLDNIVSLMPNGVQLLPDQISGLLQSPWLPRYLGMHISFHGAHFDLHRILLPGYPEAAPAQLLAEVPPDRLAEAERACLHHATSIIQLLTALNQQSSSHRLFEFDTAICVYQAIRLLLFISRFGRESQRPTPEFAASRIDLCIAALRRFFPTSVLVSPIIKELEKMNKALVQQRQEQRRQKFMQRHQAEAASTMSSEPLGSTVVVDPEQESRSESDPRERLAIHSLLRQAGFSHGEDDEEHGNGSANPEILPLTTSEALPSDPGAGLISESTANTHGYSSSNMATSLSSGSGIAGPSWDFGSSFFMDDADDQADADAMQMSIFPWLGRHDDWDLFFGPQVPVST